MGTSEKSSQKEPEREARPSRVCGRGATPADPHTLSCPGIVVPIQEEEEPDKEGGEDDVSDRTPGHGGNQTGDTRAGLRTSPGCLLRRGIQVAGR